MEKREAWDTLKGNDCECKSLSKILEEMGFDKDSYMVIRRNGPELRVSDGYDEKGYPQRNDRMSFGNCPKDMCFGVVGGGKQEVFEGKMTDFEAIDKQMSAYARLNNEGSLPNGMTGGNNGLYCAMAHNGDEFILTQDPEIKRQLEKQMGFVPDRLGVPLSNGGTIMDNGYSKDFSRMQHYSKKAQVERLSGTGSKPKYLSPPKYYSKSKAENSNDMSTRNRSYERA